MVQAFWSLRIQAAKAARLWRVWSANVSDQIRCSPGGATDANTTPPKIYYPTSFLAPDFMPGRPYLPARFA